MKLTPNDLKTLKTKSRKRKKLLDDHLEYLKTIASKHCLAEIVELLHKEREVTVSDTTVRYFCEDNGIAIKKNNPQRKYKRGARISLTPRKFTSSLPL